MVWIIVDRVVSLTFLLLAITTLILLLNTASATKEASNFGEKLELYKQESMKVMSNNINYIDGRINKSSENQDSYQVSTDQRLYVLELQVKQLLADRKNNQKIINNNSSNAVIYQNTPEQK
jgi:hypothetical protein